MSNNNAGPGDVLFGGLIAIIAAGIGLGLALGADLSDGETHAVFVTFRRRVATNG